MVTALAGDGGDIRPAGQTKVQGEPGSGKYLCAVMPGGQVDLHMAAENGFEIDELLVDGARLRAVPAYGGIHQYTMATRIAFTLCMQ